MPFSIRRSWPKIAAPALTVGLLVGPGVALASADCGPGGAARSSSGHTATQTSSGSSGQVTKASVRDRSERRAPSASDGSTTGSSRSSTSSSRTTKSSSSDSSPPSSSSSTIATSTARTGAEVEAGLQPNALKVLNAIRAEFPQITSIGGVRADALPDHPAGLALDFMINDYTTADGQDLGDEVAAYVKAHADELGVSYVIWDQEIWNVRRDAEGWRAMADRGSDSANHRNHVHVTVFAS